jgi:hypothetical protein
MLGIAMMGGEITDYQKKTVPLFIAHLKEVLPNTYAAFIKKYEGYVKEVNYVGRKALLKTINPSDIFYKSDRYPQFNEKWNWDGNILVYVSGYVHDFSITKDYKVNEIKITPSDKSTIVISNNEQVNESTIFVD